MGNSYNPGDIESLEPGRHVRIVLALEFCSEIQIERLIPGLQSQLHQFSQFHSGSCFGQTLSQRHSHVKMKDLLAIIVTLIFLPIIFPWLALKSYFRKRRILKLECPNCGSTYSKKDLFTDFGADEDYSNNDDFLLVAMPTYRLLCSVCSCEQSLDDNLDPVAE